MRQGGVGMVQKLYMDLQSDLSGSVSKNRFRNELMWGLWQIFNIYDSVEDFTIVFDYVCDIEIHLKKELKFYQIKTRNSSSPYTLNQLTKSKESSNSILGKIYVLKCKGTTQLPIKVAIVSNVTFKSLKKEYTDIQVLDFLTLDSDTREEIRIKLKNEFPTEQQINLENLYYIRSLLDLSNPKDTVLGKMISFVKNSRGKELHKPHALYMDLADTIEDKACYEFRSNTYEDLIKHKGITKKLFDSMVCAHINTSDNYIKKAKEWIENHYKNNYKEKLVMLRSLSSICSNQFKDKQLIKKKSEIHSYIKQSLDNSSISVISSFILSLDNFSKSESEIIEDVTNAFVNNFIIGYDTYCLKALVLLILKELEEKINE